jgi:molybdate transport system substrate-binding protein
MKKKFGSLLICGIVAVGMIAMLGLAACGESSSSSSSKSSSASGQTVELQIFAANSLEKALPEVQALYTKQNPNVTFKDTQFKASGDLVEQLKADSGAADLLITASTATMDTADKNGSIDANSRKDMFKNDLVVCAASSSNIKMSSLNDLATDSIKSFAIGAPASVPAGKYAAQSLQTAGFLTLADDGTTITWTNSAVQAKANTGADKVGTVASYVKQGQVDVGFVYSSDIYRYDGIKSIYTVPADAHKAIKYPGAVTKATKQASASADFLNFCMTNAEAQKIFSQYGFELAG